MNTCNLVYLSHDGELGEKQKVLKMQQQVNGKDKGNEKGKSGQGASN